MLLMQALREELRRQRSSTYFTLDKDEAARQMSTSHVDSEHNKHLESQIAEYIFYFAFVFNMPQWKESECYCHSMWHVCYFTLCWHPSFRELYDVTVDLNYFKCEFYHFCERCLKSLA